MPFGQAASLISQSSDQKRGLAVSLFADRQRFIQGLIAHRFEVEEAKRQMETQRRRQQQAAITTVGSTLAGAVVGGLALGPALTGLGGTVGTGAAASSVTGAAAGGLSSTAATLIGTGIGATVGGGIGSAISGDIQGAQKIGDLGVKVASGGLGQGRNLVSQSKSDPLLSAQEYLYQDSGVVDPNLSPSLETGDPEPIGFALPPPQSSFDEGGVQPKVRPLPRNVREAELQRARGG